jgi:putative ABC transport system permease protein
MLAENLKVALRALTANKLRSILTTLGIIIGVMSVIALLSLGNGVQQFINRQFEGQGSNLIFVFPARIEAGGANRSGFSSFGPGARSGTALSLTQRDADAMREPGVLPAVSIVAPIVSGSGKAKFNGIEHDTRVRGTVPEYRDFNDAKLLLGSYFDTQQMNAGSRVAVLGSVVYEKLFPDGGDPLGSEIRLNNISFTVIGVLAERTGGADGSDDDLITMPISTARDRLFPRRTTRGEARVDVILVQAAGTDLIDEATRQVTEKLRDLHGIEFQGEDDFSVASQRDLLNTIGSVTGAITIFLAAIAGISLFVGGIGIMNIMLVSVSERTREIGLRKAIGAPRRVILTQFLLEAVVLSLIGGLIGILLGVGIATAVAALSAGTFSALVTWDSVALAVGFSIFVGVVFGVYPAARAAKLSPIEALRYE